MEKENQKRACMLISVVVNYNTNSSRVAQYPSENSGRRAKKNAREEKET